MELHFVTHHQTLATEEVDRIKKFSPTFSVFQPIKLINLMFTSARSQHPKCKMTVLTNQSTDLEGLSEEVEIVRYPYDETGNRLAEQLSIYQFLKGYSGECPIIFLDYDTLVQGNLESVFDTDFDLFLVRRQTKLPRKPPVNMGVVGVHQHRAKQAAQFFRAIVAQITPFKELHDWGGSQLAVQKLLFDQFYHEEQREYLSYKGVKIRLLSEEYNYFPDEDFGGWFFPNKKVIHFKGVRKSFMQDYWRNYLKKTCKNRLEK